MPVKHTRKTIYDTLRLAGVLDDDCCKTAAASVFNAISEVLSTLAHGDTLELRGIGTFKAKHVAGRSYHNIATGKREMSSDHIKVKFIPAKAVASLSTEDLHEFSDMVNRNINKDA